MSEAKEPLPEVVDRRPKIETPATALSEGIEEDLKESVEQTRSGAEKAKSYEEVLQERGISLQKAHGVIDAMLSKGFYEETFTLSLPTSTAVTVTFRTRTHADYIRYLRALEAYAPKFIEEQQEIQLRYFLAASLVAFRGKAFPTQGDAQKLFDEKLDWIEAQPARIISLLAQKLNQFDVQIQAIMSEGAVENF